MNLRRMRVRRISTDATWFRRRERDARYRRALVTGASSGIGRALAAWLAARGTYVYAAARRADKLESLRIETSSSGGVIEPIVIDVTNVDDLHQRIRSLDEATGGLDLIVANAGIGGHTDAKSFDWTDFERIVRVNVLGATATLTAALPAMLKRGRGHLVAVASLAAFRGLPKDAGYGSSKAFLHSFMESLRVDLRGTGIQTTCVYPGFVKSEMTAPNTFEMPFLMETEAAAQRIGRAILAGRTEASFPWQLAALVSALRLTPRTAYDWLAARMALSRTDEN